MGTNFYWRVDPILLPNGEPVPIDRNEPSIHIGKRSSAGLYCWRCAVTLCKDGREGIHRGVPGGFSRGVTAYLAEQQQRWHTRCPVCGTAPLPFEERHTDAGRLHPVRGVCSFSWAQDPESVGVICEQRSDEQIVEDEYGDPLTGREFLDMLRADCPIQATHSIGRVFS